MATRDRARRARTRKATPSKSKRSSADADATRTRRVLVAIDGTDASAAAIRFAREMETTGLWKPEAITVVEHMPVAVADAMLPMAMPIDEPALMEGPIKAVQRQLQKHGADGWPFRSEMGPAAGGILEFAHVREVDLIVLGLGKHGKLARLFGAETAARVCRKTQVPVIAVDERAKGRPDSIVVAMDFGTSSVRAAHEALDLLAPGGKLHMVHVRWAIDGHTLGDPAWENTYALGVEQGFRQLLPQLRRDGVSVTSEMMLGGILESLLKAIKQKKADVVALGSHSQNVIDRLVLGSTPAHILRAVECSVLIAPPR
jgi:nucleotide-binding universal stress UspA family protein